MSVATFQPAEAAAVDCSIDSGNPTINQSGTTNTQQRVGVPGGGKTTNIYRGLWTWDLTSLVGIGASITAVTLDLNVIAEIAVTAIDFRILRMTQAWTEGGVTWNTYDGTNNWATAGGDFTSTGSYLFSWPNAVGIFQIPTGVNFVALIQDAIDNRSGFLDMLLKQEGEGFSGQKTLSSSNDSTPSNRPLLTITYTVGGAPRRRVHIS